jgi:molecular chaperone DnaJ
MIEEIYYELLQVSSKADLEIITVAYRALIRRHHPDRNPSPIADATKKRPNEAWEILSDPVKRDEYGRTFAAGSSSRPAPPR